MSDVCFVTKGVLLLIRVRHDAKLCQTPGLKVNTLRAKIGRYLA